MAKRRSNKPYILLHPDDPKERPLRYFEDEANFKNYVEFPTYRKLIQGLRKCAEVCSDEMFEVVAFRSRRGEWGEWFERWKGEDGKLTLVKQGWM